MILLLKSLSSSPLPLNHSPQHTHPHLFHLSFVAAFDLILGRCVQAAEQAEKSVGAKQSEISSVTAATGARPNPWPVEVQPAPHWC